jgi:hypothetical protein
MVSLLEAELDEEELVAAIERQFNPRYLLVLEPANGLLSLLVNAVASRSIGLYPTTEAGVQNRR